MKILSYHQATGWISTEDITDNCLIGYCNSNNQWINDLWIEFTNENETLSTNQYKKPTYVLSGKLAQLLDPMQSNITIHIDTYSQLPDEIQKLHTYTYNPKDLTKYRVSTAYIQVGQPTDWKNMSFSGESVPPAFESTSIGVNKKFYVHIYTKSEKAHDNQSIYIYLTDTILKNT